MRSRAQTFMTTAILALLALAVTAPAQSSPGQAERAWEEIPEAELLDVGLEILDPGLGGRDEYVLESEGVFADLRKAEARYIPVRLMDVLQATGFWGAVRVVPSANGGPGATVDVNVSGRIVESGGRKLVLEMEASDVSGRVWFRRNYKQVADPAAYAERKDGTRREPFQGLYNEIANDLLAQRNKLKSDERRELRELSRLRFAADLVPVAFDDYVGRNRKGRWEVVKLPSEDDPMIRRIAEVRDRDNLFIDTVTEHYANFVAQVEEPYDNWRKFAYEEELAHRQLKKQGRIRKILGALALIGAVAMDGDSESERAVQQGVAIAGTMAIQAGMAKSQQAKMHVESMRELASSFDAEVEPLLVDVEGQTLRLTGSVSTQFFTWRKLLREIFVNETGLPVDPDSGER